MKKLLSILVILAMLVCVASVSAVAADDPPPPPDGAGAPPAAPAEAAPAEEAPAPAGIVVTFVSDKGVELGKSEAIDGALVFGIKCSSPTDITTITAAAGVLECQQSTAGGPMVPQGTINGIWNLTGLTEATTVTLVLNTKEGAALPEFFFGAEEAKAGVGSGGMGGPPPAAPAPVYDIDTDTALITFVSDQGAQLATANASGGELVFGLKCSPPTDVTTFEIDGASLICQRSTAGGPMVPQGTINGIWTINEITGPVTVTLVLNTQEGAAPPEFFFGAEEAAAGVGGGGMAGPAPVLAGPPTGGVNPALIVLIICLCGAAVLIPVAVKKHSK